MYLIRLLGAAPNWTCTDTVEILWTACIHCSDHDGYNKIRECTGGEIAEDWEQRSLKDETGYNWTMGKEDAEIILKESEKKHCYIIRYCEECKKYELSVKMVKKTTPKFEHYALVIKHIPESNTNTYKLKGDTMPEFSKLSEFIDHYKKNPIGRTMKNIGVPLVYQSEESITTISEPKNLSPNQV